MKRYRKEKEEVYYKIFILGVLSSFLFMYLFVLGLLWLGIIIHTIICILIIYNYTHNKFSISTFVYNNKTKSISINGSSRISVKKLEKLLENNQ